MVCFTVGKKYMRIGNYIKIGTFIIIGIFVFPYVLCAQNGYYFFSDSDKVAIRNSANTLWGSVIVESMKEKVKERRSHKNGSSFVRRGASS